MAMIQVASMCENSIKFPLHELFKNDKGHYIAKTNQIINDVNAHGNNIEKLIPIPAFKEIVIIGKHTKYRISGIMSPYALTEIDDKTWEHIKIEYAHSYEIKSGLIFADKDNIKTELKARDQEIQSIETTTKKRTEKTMTDRASINNISGVEISKVMM